MAAIGALAGTIGIDIYDGTERYTFGFQYLLEGLHLVPLAMGLFGLSEVIASIRGSDYRPRHVVRLRAMLPTARDWKRSLLPTLRASGYRRFFGPLPGTGPTVATLPTSPPHPRLSPPTERCRQGH